jgi:hypothetical protein
VQLDEGGESGVDLAFGGGLQDRELHPLRARRFLSVSNEAQCIRIARIYEQGNHLGLGNQLGQQLEPLWRQLEVDNAKARDVAARPGETGDQAAPDWVADTGEDDRDRPGFLPVDKLPQGVRGSVFARFGKFLGIFPAAGA